MRLGVVAFLAAAPLLAAPALAQQKINVGHLADYSGPTSDVGVPYGNGVADALSYINKHGGAGGKVQMNVDAIDYGYQVPRSIAAYKKWVGRDNVVAIFGWGTADTEALISFVTKDQVPYMSASYAGALTDPVGRAEKTEKPAPFNFFYSPSYSDANRGLVQWAADDWKKKGGSTKPKYVHMGANHPYPNAPKAAGEGYATELGFEVLPAIQYPLAPGDFTAQCLTLKQSGANYAYLGNTSGSNVSMLKACQTAGVEVQFLANVWGMDENAAKAAGAAANGVAFPVGTGALWGDNVPGMALVKEVAKQSDPSGANYRAIHYLRGVCATFYMSEAIAIAAQKGKVTGPAIAQALQSKKDWVPAKLDGVCRPSTWTATDHRPTTQVEVYKVAVAGATEPPVGELMQKGVIKFAKSATINLPRKPEWLGW
ncbi:MAG: ABC transporter substrate-binding protein [Proteobacteria bacterium]|nr:ABC transporter substrate-binding protein [Pseudomonadota bacterium]